MPAQARPVCARPSRPLTPSALRSSGPPERPAGKGAGRLLVGHVTPARWPPRAGAAAEAAEAEGQRGRSEEPRPDFGGARTARFRPPVSSPPPAPRRRDLEVPLPESWAWERAAEKRAGLGHAHPTLRRRAVLGATRAPGWEGPRGDTRP